MVDFSGKVGTSALNCNGADEVHTGERGLRQQKGGHGNKDGGALQLPLFTIVAAAAIAAPCKLGSPKAHHTPALLVIAQPGAKVFPPHT